MEINQIKLARQLEVVEKWKAAGFKGTLCAVTGFGKSYVGILIIQRMLKNNPNSQTLVIVPTIQLKIQWEELLTETKTPNVEVTVINTAVKSVKSVNLLILDEIHRYASDVFQHIFSTVTYSGILGLTATMKRQDDRHYMLEKEAPIIDTIDLKEALAKQYISPFRIYNYGIEMGPEDAARYAALHKNFIRFFKMFNFDFNVAMRALGDRSFRDTLAKQTGFTAQETYMFAINFSKAMQLRKKFLYNIPSKLSTAKELVMKYPVNTITFSETIKFAEEITEVIGKDISFAFHSGLSAKRKKSMLERYRDPSDPLRVINTARSLDEGFDVKDIELAIICSGSSTSRQYIQRIGRAVRYQEDKIATIINLYIKDSRDENWLLKRGVMPNVYWINSLEELQVYDSFLNKREDAIQTISGLLPLSD